MLPLQTFSMRINNKPYRTIWEKADSTGIVQVIDQRVLPFELRIADWQRLEDAAAGIRDMQVRGAPLIGSAAAYGMWLGIREQEAETNWPRAMAHIAKTLLSTRPTAVNLHHAVEAVLNACTGIATKKELEKTALNVARQLTEESVEHCRAIGEHGLELIRDIYRRKQKPVNILTHCNAGWLACLDYGTATAPIYLAHDEGIPVHVWVDETRPRNQGARLTAFELGQHGVPHTVVADNTGGHLMQHGMVDLVLVGSDRTTRTGDVANKIGTYLKALAAHDNGVPFYVALPSSSIDWSLRNGRDIEIEQRNPDEVQFITGHDGQALRKVRLTPEHSPAANYAFDVTPARLVTGLITERGICEASEKGLTALFPECS